jgi:hypothetical protein
MHERTFVLSMLALDALFITAGGMLAWLRALPRLPFMKAAAGADPIAAVLSTLLIAGIGGWMLYELNVFAFRLAESSDPDRTARRITVAFLCATILGGAAGMAAG